MSFASWFAIHPPQQTDPKSLVAFETHRLPFREWRLNLTGPGLTYLAPYETGGIGVGGRFRPFLGVPDFCFDLGGYPPGKGKSSSKVIFDGIC